MSCSASTLSHGPHENLGAVRKAGQIAAVARWQARRRVHPGEVAWIDSFSVLGKFGIKKPVGLPDEGAPQVQADYRFRGTTSASHGELYSIYDARSHGEDGVFSDACLETV